MVSTPIVSVVMPTKNSEKYLKEAINSILSQTFMDFEFIVVDDQSNDNTVSIIKSYSDPRVHIISGNNKGISAALNQGIRYSTGKYIARMDADDISLPTRFEAQVKFLEENPHVGVCGTKVNPISDQALYDSSWGEWIKTTPKVIDLLGPVVFCHPTVFLRRSIVDKYDLYYNEDLNSAEDQELWFRAIRVTDFYNIDQQLLLYRIHKDNSTRKNSDKSDIVLHRLKMDLLDWLGVEEIDYDHLDQEALVHKLFDRIEKNHYLELFQELKRSRWIKIGRKIGFMKRIMF